MTSTSSIPRSLETLNWQEVEALGKRTTVAIIPIAQVAQHGLHLPLGTDGIQLMEVARRVVARLEENGRTALIAPLVPFGLSPTHRDFAGCLNLRPETLTSLLVDIAVNLVRDGFRRIVLLSGTGGNWPAIDSAAFHIPEATGAQVFTLGFFEAMGAIKKEILESDQPQLGQHDGHAGELETSCILAIAPHLVRAEEAKSHMPAIVAEVNRIPFSGMNWNGKRRSISLTRSTDISHDGHWGNPELASAEKGERLLSRCADVLAEHFLRYIFKDTLSATST